MFVFNFGLVKQRNGQKNNYFIRADLCSVKSKL
jgi:hypothetical protein